MKYCKECGIGLSNDYIMDRFCTYSCRNKYYKINERNQISDSNKPHKIPTITRKAFIFCMYYYYGLQLRRKDRIKEIIKEMPFLLRDEKFKTEIEKCIK